MMPLIPSMKFTMFDAPTNTTAPISAIHQYSQCSTPRLHAIRAIDEAEEFAKNSPEPNVEDLLNDVYA